MQPDATDWKIIDILRKENQTNNKIAKDLGVSEGMIRRRIQRLKDAGILQIRALINTDMLEQQQLALIGVNVTESRLLETKGQEISGLSCVLSVSLVSGRYDLIVEVLVDSNHGLVKFLTESLSNIEGISKTESFLMLKSYHKFV
jgi:Lrp/AsnC family transcriptional regulator, regulator for asnA, asnC and gidA